MADSQRKTANMVDISTYTASGGQGSKYEYFRNVTLSAGTYTFSCRQNNTLSSATRNSLFVAIGGNLTYESTATDYHLNVGLHSLTFTLESEQIIILGYWTNTLSNGCVYDEFMLNTGSTPLPYEPYGWIHSLRKLGTSTDTITMLPAIIYPNDTTATVGLKGNMEQTGTPTPQNPIQPLECGDLTGNLFDATIEQGSITSSGDIPADNRIRTREFSNIESEYITLSWSSEQNTEVYIMMYDTNGDYVRGDGWTTSPTTYRLLSTIKKIRIIWRYESQADITPSAITNIMLNSGSTALPYEPYGYKIPISSADTTTNIYLGEVQSTRKIAKYEFTGQENDWKVASGRFYNDNVVTDYMLNISDYAYCTHFNVIEQQTSASPVHDGDICFRNGNPRVYIYNGNCETVTDFTTWLQQQYSNGTPVTVWYVLATPTTGIVNEPIRKIGEYADTVSGITIPTIAGANTIDVQTALKPSEVSVNYHGWHPVSSVHERDNGAWT